MLGEDGRLYDPMYDFDEDGMLDVYEEAVAFDELFDRPHNEASSVDYEDEEEELDVEEFDTDEIDVDELDVELEMAGLNRYELESMDEDERREALEDAGLDPDDYDDF